MGQRENRTRFAGRRMLRPAAGLLAALFLCLFMAGPAAAETPGEKYRRLKEELQATRDAIKGYENSLASSQQLKEELEKQKAIIDEMVELNRQEIARTEAELAAKENEVAEKRRSIYENDQLLRRRLVAIYTMNNSDVMGQLLAAEDFSDFVLILDGMRRISKHDTDLLTLLDSERQQLEARQAEIDAQLLELQAYYAELLINQQDLADNIAAANQSISWAQAQLAAQKQIEGDQYAALLQAQNEMQAIAGKIGGSSYGDGSAYVGGTFIWPVPGYYGISCQFGEPDPNGRAHRGMDIHTNRQIGPDIVACGGGTVIEAAYGANSYGNYLVIDHGDGVKTLYAHCDKLYASVGADVAQGQTVAAVGSTGFSTGPHLHLEVFNQGGLENPINWLKG